MISRFFMYLTSISPKFRENLWQCWYERISAFYPKQDFRFMNYGFAPVDGENRPILEDADEENRLFIQLYDHTLSGISLEGKEVLEVGSGRGGGAEFVAKYLKPASLIGVDFSKNAVNLANQFNKAQNLKFIEGNAEKLPFKDDSFDVVFNVESSHCYGNMEAFIAEVRRVLKPGGTFAWSDLRKKRQMEIDNHLFMNSGLTLISKENITPEILRALEMISKSKEKAIKEKVPSLFQKIFKEFAGTQDSAIFRGFKEGSMVYWHYVLKKSV